MRKYYSASGDISYSTDYMRIQYWWRLGLLQRICCLRCGQATEFVDSLFIPAGIKARNQNVVLKIAKLFVQISLKKRLSRLGGV